MALVRRAREHDGPDRSCEICRDKVDGRHDAPAVMPVIVIVIVGGRRPVEQGLRSNSRPAREASMLHARLSFPSRAFAWSWAVLLGKTRWDLDFRVADS